MIVHAYYPIGETRVQREAAALVDAGFAVEVIALRDEGELATEVIDGVLVHRLPVKRHRGTSMARQALEYLAFLLSAGFAVTKRHLRSRFDVVQVHNLPDALVFAALIPKLMGAKVILDLHDLMPEFFAGRTGAGLSSPLVRVVAAQERISCLMADRVITVSEGWRRTLVERGVAEYKTAVVMNVADSALFRRSEAGVAQNDFRIIYHGTFTERYGVDILVRAVAVLKDEIEGIRLDLLGDGDQRDDIVSLVSQLGVGEIVHLSEGMLGAGELPGHISQATVGVVPNRSNIFTDGLLPTKLLEYVAMGTPVVASWTPTVAEYFDESMVEYFPAGDADALAAALARVWRSPDKRAALSAASDRFNAEHSWESVASGYVDLVADLVGERRVDVHG